MTRKDLLIATVFAGFAITSPALAGASTAASPSTGAATVPDPGMLGILGASLIGLGLARRRRGDKIRD